MGVLSFFSQIGNLIFNVVEFFIHIIQGAINFVSNVVFSFNFLTQFTSYMPVELGIGFRVLICISVITLIVRLI